MKRHFPRGHDDNLNLYLQDPDAFFATGGFPQWLELGPRVHVLDFCAGLGRNVPAALALSPNVHVTMLDAQPVLERARKVLFPRLTLEQLERVHFSYSLAAHDHFDVIVCDRVLQHIDNPHQLRALLAAFKRLSPLLYVSGRRWIDNAGTQSSVWREVAAAGWRLKRASSYFEDDKRPDAHHKAVYER